MSTEAPKSWGDLLRQREAERNAPPPKEFYVKSERKYYKDAGIIPTAGSDMRTQNPIFNMDTHFYATTHIFDPLDEKQRHVKPSHDHGLGITAWPTKTKEEREAEDLAALTNRTHRRYPQTERREFDVVSGVPHQSAFKSGVQQILKQREIAAQSETTRAFNPVSNTYPTEALESRRINDEAVRTQKEFEYRQSKLSANERRAKNSLVNIVTGEVKEDLTSAFQQFRGDPRRAARAYAREREMLAEREETVRAKTAMVGCRYNNGRMKEIRNWNIINGESTKVTMDESVKMKPSVWQWLQTERLDVE